MQQYVSELEKYHQLRGRPFLWRWIDVAKPDKEYEFYFRLPSYEFEYRLEAVIPALATAWNNGSNEKMPLPDFKLNIQINDEDKNVFETIVSSENNYGIISKEFHHTAPQNHRFKMKVKVVQSESQERFSSVLLLVNGPLSKGQDVSLGLAKMYLPVAGIFFGASFVELIWRLRKTL